MDPDLADYEQALELVNHLPAIPDNDENMDSNSGAIVTVTIVEAIVGAIVVAIVGAIGGANSVVTIVVAMVGGNSGCQ